jgi:hypothetical protein
MKNRGQPLGSCCGFGNPGTLGVLEDDSLSGRGILACAVCSAKKPPFRAFLSVMGILQQLILAVCYSKMLNLAVRHSDFLPAASEACTSTW